MKQIILTLILFTMSSMALAQSVVPLRAIRSGSIIGAEDVTSIKDEFAGTYKLIDAVIGKEARVTLYPGRPIHLANIGPPALLERNQIVKMTFQMGGLTISAEGRVLDRAGAGDRVRVMNMTSRQTVIGTVKDNGTIKVGRQ